MRTTDERIAFTTVKINDLRAAIADAGNAVADRALPLYAKLAEALKAAAAERTRRVQEQASRPQGHHGVRRDERDAVAQQRDLELRELDAFIAAHRPPSSLGRIQYQGRQ